MKLEVLTPEKTLFKGEVESVTLPGVDGSFQLLNNHAPIVSALGKGALVIKAASEDCVVEATFNSSNREHATTISGGVVEMSNNKAIVLIQ